MAAPTMRDRVLALRRGLRRSDLISAILGLDPAEVAATLSDPSHQPPSPGGSGGSGVVVRKFPFAFDTPNLVTGHTVYTPTTGDVLLDAWLQIDTAWDGTTPLCDFGEFGGPLGWLGHFWGATVDMTQADAARVAQNVASLSAISGAFAAEALYRTGASSGNAFSPNPNASAMNANNRIVPLPLDAGSPIAVCVSTDGTLSGASPGAAQGAAILYLVTATPV